MKRLVILLCLLLPCVNASSQMLNCFELGTNKTYTKAQIVKVYGKPDFVYDRSWEDADWFVGLLRWNKSELIFCEDGMLSEFKVFDSRFIVMPDIISEGLKVGDILTQEKLNILKKELVGGMDYKKEYGVESFVKGDWDNGFYYQLGDWAYFSIGIDKNHVITSMSFQIRD